jgi:hypothetical protein
MRRSGANRFTPRYAWLRNEYLDQDGVGSGYTKNNSHKRIGDQYRPGSPKEVSLDNFSVVAELGREMTQRDRYRAWEVL